MSVLGRLTIFLLLASPVWAASSYQRALVIDHTKVPNTDQTNFPVLVSVCDPGLKTAGNGGHVQESHGYDITFWTDTSLSTALMWEMESFNGGTGCLIAWVKIPTVSHTTDTVFYMFYGDSSVSSFQSTPGNVWSNNYKQVYHFPDGSTLGLNSSVSSPNNGTNHSATAASGNIYGAAGTGASKYITVPDTSLPVVKPAMSMTMWLNGPSASTTSLCVDYGTNNPDQHIYLGIYDLGGGAPQHALIAGQGSANIRSGTNINDGAWHYAVLTVDTSGVFLLYLDGAQQSTTTFGSLNLTQSGAIYIGRDLGGTQPCTASLDELRILGRTMTADEITTNWNNQHSPSTFVTLGSESTTSGTTLTAASPIPISSSGFSLLLTGNGTSWTPGTPGSPSFAASGVAGVSITGQTVLSATSAVVTVASGNATGAVTISDGGSLSTVVQVVSPGLNATWSGPWRYNDYHAGNESNGDTWLMMNTVNGYRSTCNDCLGLIVGGAWCNSGSASNVAFFGQSSDLTSATCINSMHGLGGAGQGGLGYCSIFPGGTYKTVTPLSYNGLYIIPLFCQRNGPPFDAHHTSYLISTSTDDGAHWWRGQDAYKASAGSWSANVATLTTATNPLNVGDLIIVTGCSPAAYNTLPGTATVLTGSDSTHVKYTLASNPGAYVSGCTVLGPGAAGATPPTTEMWTAGPMIRPYFAQICIDNMSCSATPDSTDLYLVGVALDGNNQNPIAFRVLKSDMNTSPGDATKYQYWNGSGWVSNIASAVQPTCISNGVSSTCTSFGTGVTYFADAALPDGGQYFMVGYRPGQLGIWSASHIYGPWTLQGARTIDSSQNPPTAFGFPNTSPGLYTPVSSNPYRAIIRLQADGVYTSDYSIFHFDINLSAKTPNTLSLFNKSRTQGRAGNEHVQNGLDALWRMQTYYDQQTLFDESPNAADVSVANATAAPNEAFTSASGLENTNPVLNASWGANGGAWALPTGWNKNLGDFTVLFVGRSDLTGTQTAMGASQTTGTGFLFKLISGAMHFIVRGGAIDVTCAGTPQAGVFGAWIGLRRGATAYCFKSDAAAPASAGSDGTTLGAFNLRLGSEQDGAPNYWRGTIGEVAIWRRALCSYLIGGSCLPGQADEVQSEFQTVARESKTRGWGIQ
jgi:hypothetical protein